MTAAAGFPTESKGDPDFPCQCPSSLSSVPHPPPTHTHTFDLKRSFDLFKHQPSSVILHHLPLSRVLLGYWKMLFALVIEKGSGKLWNSLAYTSVYWHACKYAVLSVLSILRLYDFFSKFLCVCVFVCVFVCTHASMWV